jgi:ubiquinone/menaquinone biosynthesis C-methylase UbiE
MTTTVTTPKFSERTHRSQWLYQKFEHIFHGKTLDVGCYEAPLRQIIGAEKYIGIDFIGKPDIRINLEQIDRLPFDDKSFESVICIEVLEHLDNLHELIPELFRTSSRYVLISLPNAWRDARVKIEKGRGSIAHYGLHVQKPKDRHKWFFNAAEAKNFLENSTPQNWTSEIIFTIPKKSSLMNLFRKIRYSKESFANRYVQTVWALFEKNN